MKDLPASAIVLCGGVSTRMGRDKASLPFGDETLLDRVIRIVQDQFDDVVIAAGDSQEVPAGVEVVRDTVPGLGPLPALLRALSRVRNERAFVVACDTPLLQPTLVSTLVRFSLGWEACVPVVDGVRMTTCAVYGTAAATRVAGGLMAVESAGLRTLAARLETRFVHADELRDADPNLLSFVPCNTPNEYRRVLELAGLVG
ncbi:MAG: molybdenum cofactor guanylyltransferase [Acidobacteriota bacterium]|nr:molybdenum cofactor guanylyltransferase [Acidobacteriota bacterium]